MPGSWGATQLAARGGRLWAATEQAWRCALPADARGCELARLSEEIPRWTLWGAQRVMDAGASAQMISHADACRLWAGEDLDVFANGCDEGFVSTEHGAPLGWVSRGRLQMPSRLTRAGLR